MSLLLRNKAPSSGVENSGFLNQLVSVYAAFPGRKTGYRTVSLFQLTHDKSHENAPLVISKHLSFVILQFMEYMIYDYLIAFNSK